MFTININMYIVLFAIFGLCVGSFVNAFVWRLKRTKTGLRVAVFARTANTNLLKDLIPVISWLWLRGKCRYCNKKIDDNPLTEVIVAVIFVGSYAFWPFAFDGEGWFRLATWLVAFTILAAMFLYDLKWMVLPNKLTYALLGLAIIQTIVVFIIRDFDYEVLRLALLSMVVGGALFHLMYLGSKGKYIGGGDVKLGYAYGLLLLDPILPWLVLTVASIAGSVIAICLLVTKRAKMGTKLPFGPMLIGGVVVVMIWGQKLWNQIYQLWY